GSPGADGHTGREPPGRFVVSLRLYLSGLVGQYDRVQEVRQANRCAKRPKSLCGFAAAGPAVHSTATQDRSGGSARLALEDGAARGVRPVEKTSGDVRACHRRSGKTAGALREHGPPRTGPGHTHAVEADLQSSRAVLAARPVPAG